jgi:outer membrane lipoprotein-sorting protein
MNCQECKKLLLFCALDELSPAQKVTVDQHLEGCEDCRATLAEYIKMRQKIATLQETPDLPDITGTVMTKIHSRPVPPKMNWYRGWRRPVLAAIPLAAIIVVLLVLSPWNTVPGIDTVMAKASDAVARIQSYQSTFVNTTIQEGLTIQQTAQWGFSGLNRWHETLTLEEETYEIIIIGDTKYVRNPPNHRLTLADLIPSAPAKGEALQILQSLDNLEKLPQERIEGKVCLHFKGNIDMERRIMQVKNTLDPRNAGYAETLRQLEGLREVKAEVEVWIDKADYFIRKVEQNTVSPQGQYTSVNTYRNFNQPVTIDPPITQSGKLVSGWEQFNSFSLGPFFQPPSPSGNTPASPDMETYRKIAQTVNMSINIPTALPSGMWFHQAQGSYDSSGSDITITLIYAQIQQMLFSRYIAFQQTIGNGQEDEISPELQKEGFQEIEIQGETGCWRQGRLSYADYNDPSSQYWDITQIEVNWKIAGRSYSLYGRGISLEQLVDFANSLQELK